MAVKPWFDKDIIKFVKIKANHPGNLWSSNNSVLVDAEFWREAVIEGTRASAVFNAVAQASYFDGTGEPGFINADKLEAHETNLHLLENAAAFSSPKYPLSQLGFAIIQQVNLKLATHRYVMIVNPCGEVSIRLTGAYCVIADVVPLFADSDDDAEATFRLAARALIRTNLMPSLYNGEVKRTNRIGVGMTGIHEYAWKRFGYGFRDLLQESNSLDFWHMLSRFSNAVKDEAALYSAELGVENPHTAVTNKPAGTTSKLFGLTEGAHLPAMRNYLRWVQFRNDDPLVQQYKNAGYPTQVLTTYPDTTVVGFLTTPRICTYDMGDKLVLAGEATPEEQYQWLMLLEKYWLGDTQANQISYTLKYDPNVVSFEEFKSMMLQYQPQIKCCSVMPTGDTSFYEYLPEQPVSAAEFAAIKARIPDTGAEMEEQIDFRALQCSTGACPL